MHLTKMLQIFSPLINDAESAAKSYRNMPLRLNHVATMSHSICGRHLTRQSHFYFISLTLSFSLPFRVPVVFVRLFGFWECFVFEINNKTWAVITIRSTFIGGASYQICDTHFQSIDFSFWFSFHRWTFGIVMSAGKIPFKISDWVMWFHSQTSIFTISLFHSLFICP